jgi:methanogenic corrinoid protein MtbC1
MIAADKSTDTRQHPKPCTGNASQSALLTTVQDAIRETIVLITKGASGELKSCKTIVGGGFMDEKVCRYVGANYWAKDAMSGVRYCQKLSAPL